MATELFALWDRVLAQGRGRQAGEVLSVGLINLQEHGDVPEL